MYLSTIHSREVLRGFAVAGSLAVVLAAGLTTTARGDATHSSENLTVATVSVEGLNEGVIFLDHVTGEMTGYVLNTKSWRFFATFKANNVKADLGITGTRSPKFVLVTGKLDFTPQGANRLGNGVIYVAEETSGKMVAYGIPWRAGAMASGTPVNAAFVKLTPAPVPISSAVRRPTGTGPKEEPQEEEEPATPGNKKIPSKKIKAG